LATADLAKDSRDVGVGPTPQAHRFGSPVLDGLADAVMLER
jgi:hypothetical protein